MRKELGKWLMDIAKYITTAVVLTSIFGDVQEKVDNILGGSLAIVITLLAGLWLVNDKKRDDKMGALIMFGLVSVIAIVGVIYFNHKDKKTIQETHKLLSNV